MHPDDPSHLISHETIHAAIYAQPKGGLKAGMIAALQQHKPARGLRRTTLAGGSIAPESLRIIPRPEEIEARLVPGHREGDPIKGAFNRSAVGRWSSARPAILFSAIQASSNRSGGSIGAQNARLHRRGGAGRVFTTDETTACRAAPSGDLRPWIGNGLPPGTGAKVEDRHPVLRSARPLAARFEREHQRSSAPVLPQGHRPERHQPDGIERRRPPDEPAPPQDPRMENTRGSHDRRTRGLQINRCA